MEYEYKEVYFDQYCKTCKHADLDDVKDPCNECLGEPANMYSHKPVNYEEDPRRVKQNEISDKRRSADSSV